MRRIRLKIAYDGTNYKGYQLQPNVPTIEKMMNEAIFQLTGEELQVMGASRTDSGVHALGNYVVFDTESRIPGNKFAPALNKRLPDDILVVESAEVEHDWHPRRRKCTKTYEYHIMNTRTRIPTKRLTNYFVSFPLDEARMQKAADYLIGEHDFISFCNVKSTADTTVRTILDLSVTRVGEEITIRITGNGFLYNMVRIIAGTLVHVGRGFYEPEKVKEMLEACDRQSAGGTAPPQGLILVSIDYLE